MWYVNFIKHFFSLHFFYRIEINQNGNKNNQVLGRERGFLGQYPLAMLGFIGGLLGSLENPWFIFSMSYPVENKLLVRESFCYFYSIFRKECDLYGMFYICCKVI